jgi:hypothetical protein
MAGSVPMSCADRVSGDVSVAGASCQSKFEMQFCTAEQVREAGKMGTPRVSKAAAVSICQFENNGKSI